MRRVCNQQPSTHLALVVLEARWSSVDNRRRKNAKKEGATATRSAKEGVHKETLLERLSHSAGEFKCCNLGNVSDIAASWALTSGSQAAPPSLFWQAACRIDPLLCTTVP